MFRSHGSEQRYPLACLTRKRKKSINKVSNKPASPTGNLLLISKQPTLGPVLEGKKTNKDDA